MQGGLGEIQLEFDADLPPGGPNRTLIFENHHQSRIGAYLVNCLVPNDPAIQIRAQHRNYQQSFYQLDYAQAGVVRASCHRLGGQAIADFWDWHCFFYSRGSPGYPGSAPDPALLSLLRPCHPVGPSPGCNAASRS